ncbi:unnamed protein product [Closterium sp. NIES-53]
MGSITADDDHVHLRVPNVPAMVAKSFHERVAETQSLLSNVGRQAKAMAEKSTARERVIAAVAALLAVALVAFSVALSLRPPPSIVDAPLFLDTLCKPLPPCPALPCPALLVLFPSSRIANPFLL